ncbi:b2815d7e-977a-4bf9-a0ca-b3cff0e5d4aa [Sclerotinia trifoliorum]|uniref:non-specific serine/threonine protein kinase n=1 Tax=Sclerotinia trifoliorum TaxID=28548 RepID=A0A8H2ZPH6_9HELO|nr:b2815d7e-977a-4bf9-a0ca-b3cff0e5d4aa [Sclerotinia trifoliorum]
MATEKDPDSAVRRKQQEGGKGGKGGGEGKWGDKGKGKGKGKVGDKSGEGDGSGGEEEEEVRTWTRTRTNRTALAGSNITTHLIHNPEIIAVRVIRAFRCREVRQNKWCSVKHNLTAENIEIDACIANGSFGVVFRAENKDTRVDEKPGIKYAIKVSNLRLDDSEDRLEIYMGSDHSPVLTRSSEASIQEEEEMRRRSLYSKRAREIRTSLEYIKTGHFNVCNLEGWAEFDILGSHFIMTIMELCDIGTLDDMVSMMIANGEYIPEAFIWHASEQLFDGLAFLHGEHPEYRDKPEFRGDKSTILRDIKADNIFLKSPPANSPPDIYPTLKLADFGEAIHLPKGGTRDLYFGNSSCEPPDTKLSAKFDVWSVGAQLYYMAKMGNYPNVGCVFRESGKKVLWGDMGPRKREKVTEARNNPDRFQLIDDHLTAELQRFIRGIMNLDRHQRPTALEVFRKAQVLNGERKKLMYRKLPDFINMSIARPFATLELVDTEWRMEQAEREGFLFQYGGGLPVKRRMKDRVKLWKTLVDEKALERAKVEKRKLELDKYMGMEQHANLDRGRRSVLEAEEIDKINKERKDNGGWLLSEQKRRKVNIRKRRVYGVGEV